MGGWQEERLRELRYVENDRTMFDKICAWAKELGFEYCVFAIRAPMSVSKPTTFAATNCPESWRIEYQRNNYLSIDPAVQRSLRSQDMFVWSDEVFAEAPEFWRAAQAHGLRFGLTIPTRGNHGVVGILSLARSSGEISDAELEENKFKLAWLAQMAHQGMAKHLLPESLSSSIGIKLSERETAVLRWTAEGKTSEEIAEILNISERTVNFHINNAVTKMGAANRTAATVQAALQGLL